MVTKFFDEFDLFNPQTNFFIGNFVCEVLECTCILTFSRALCTSRPVHVSKQLFTWQETVLSWDLFLFEPVFTDGFDCSPVDTSCVSTEEQQTLVWLWGRENYSLSSIQVLSPGKHRRQGCDSKSLHAWNTGFNVVLYNYRRLSHFSAFFRTLYRCIV